MLLLCTFNELHLPESVLVGFASRHSHSLSLTLQIPIKNLNKNDKKAKTKMFSNQLNYSKKCNHSAF